MPEPESDLKRMMRTVPQTGRLEQILLRRERKGAVDRVDTATVVMQHGLEGDRFRGRNERAKRQITIIQAEHLPVIAALSGHAVVDPLDLRRNLVIAGIPVAAMKDRRFRIGDRCVLEWTAPCAPCHRIETLLGAGGFNAMRGMGGVCCRVVEPGEIRVGDPVVAA
ncbi:MAG: MOSC domain-containing protein [Myxococcota bacterium]|nr:MOSC domain-containing protein [Myxococcota bacterium]